MDANERGDCRRILAGRLIAVVLFARGLCLPVCADTPQGPNPWGYAVVVSRETAEMPEWREVVDALLAKHDGERITYGEGPREALARLQVRHPRYTCFVARYEEVTRSFVAEVHQLVTELDDDPYADTVWGIVTGYNAGSALRMAGHRDPLTVRKVASGTEIALEMCREGVCYDELVKNKLVRKTPGRTPVREQCPDDTTQALVDTLDGYQPDLLVTSGHASEHDWQIGYRYKNGRFFSRAGQLFGRDTTGRVIPIDSPNPKVYLPVGNCLMGHIDGPDSMALAWMNDAGVLQMIGYTKPTWYGYAGWGCLDYFLKQPGRYTFAEAFQANMHALRHRLAIYAPNGKLTNAAVAAGLTQNDVRGLRFDSDVVAFYGDPAWEARMAPGKPAYSQTLQVKGDTYTLEVRPRRGAKSFEPVNTNGSQRGGRPIIQFLPRRVGNVDLLRGAELNPVVTDDFVLVPRPATCRSNDVFVVSFRATPVH